MEQKAPTVGDVYRHYKGNRYRVLHIATHTESEEVLVVYQSLCGDQKVWARPLEMFMEEVVLPDGSNVPRFALTDDWNCKLN